MRNLIRGAVPLVLLALTLASGCDEDVDPESGTWVFDQEEILRNTCNYDDIAISEGTFEVLNHGDGTLTIDPQDGSDPFECKLDGSSFSCPERLQENQDISGFDATLVVRVAAEGAFDDSRSASGQQNGRITCNGSSCDQLASLVGASLPCELDASFDARKAD